MAKKEGGMDARTLEALNGSIAKWEAIVAGTGVDSGTSNCPLCQAFNADDDTPSCAGCPVAEATEETWCDGSPYATMWDQAESPRNANGTGYAHTAESLAAAQAELDFLRSLLPDATLKTTTL